MLAQVPRRQAHDRAQWDHSSKRVRTSAGCIRDDSAIQFPDSFQRSASLGDSPMTLRLAARTAEANEEDGSGGLGGAAGEFHGVRTIMGGPAGAIGVGYATLPNELI